MYKVKIDHAPGITSNIFVYKSNLSIVKYKKLTLGYRQCIMCTTVVFSSISYLGRKVKFSYINFKKGIRNWIPQKCPFVDYVKLK